VAYGDNGGEGYTPDDVRHAVRIAQGTEFVEKMDKAYNAAIAQGGTNVSGGQKQRLSIARAVCRKPEVYIFDDSFSALDYKTDRALRSELKRETSGVTSLIVAQRIGTIMDADQIIVLDEGRIVGRGTHEELLRDCTVYKEIAMSQVSEEELAS
jgi:ATP-binding cassette subfamily B protein